MTGRALISAERVSRIPSAAAYSLLITASDAAAPAWVRDREVDREGRGPGRVPSAARP